MLRRLLLLAGLLALVVALVAGASPASAQYARQNFISCTPTTAAPGQTVTCQAGYFDAGSTVTWTLNSDPVTLGATTVAGTGIASITFAVPTGFSAGAHTVTASGRLAGVDQALATVSAAITVTASSSAAAPPRSSNLPTTGSSNVGLFTGVAAVLIAGGGVALMASRRRSPVSSSR